MRVGIHHHVDMTTRQIFRDVAEAEGISQGQVLDYAARNLARHLREKFPEKYGDLEIPAGGIL